MERIQLADISAYLRRGDLSGCVAIVAGEEVCGILIPYRLYEWNRECRKDVLLTIPTETVQVDELDRRLDHRLSQAPVAVMSDGKPIGILVSPPAFQAIRGSRRVLSVEELTEAELEILLRAEPSEYSLAGSFNDTALK